MHFAKPIKRTMGAPSGPRTARNIEHSIALLSQEIVVTERRLAMLEAQRRYEQMNLDELRTVRNRPMSVLRAPRPEPRPTATVKVVKRAPYKTQLERDLEAKAAEIFGDLLS